MADMNRFLVLMNWTWSHTCELPFYSAGFFGCGGHINIDPRDSAVD